MEQAKQNDSKKERPLHASLSFWVIEQGAYPLPYVNVVGLAVTATQETVALRSNPIGESIGISSHIGQGPYLKSIIGIAS